MSRITKTIAEQVAELLVKPKREEIKSLREALKERVTAEFIKHIPAELMDQFKKHPKYFNLTGSTRLDGPGFNREYYSLTNNLPYDGEYPKIPSQIANKIISLNDKLEDKKNACNQLKKEIEVALFNLRTYANVEREFPEAFPLLPATTSTALVINISDIRSKIA